MAGGSLWLNVASGGLFPESFVRKPNSSKQYWNHPAKHTKRWTALMWFHRGPKRLESTVENISSPLPLCSLSCARKWAECLYCHFTGCSRYEKGPIDCSAHICGKRFNLSQWFELPNWLQENEGGKDKEVSDAKLQNVWHAAAGKHGMHFPFAEIIHTKTSDLPNTKHDYNLKVLQIAL